MYGICDICDKADSLNFYKDDLMTYWLCYDCYNMCEEYENENYLNEDEDENYDNKEENNIIKYSSDDIIISIFYLIEIISLPASPQIVHKFIFELKKDYSNLLSMFEFLDKTCLDYGSDNILSRQNSDKRNYPFSKLLEKTLLNLQINGLLNIADIENMNFEISDKSKKNIKNNILNKKFSNEEQKELKQIAKGFEKIAFELMINEVENRVVHQKVNNILMILLKK